MVYRIQTKSKLQVRTLDENGEVYIKYRIIDSGVDGNGHGVTWDSIKKNLKTAIGKPYIEVPEDFTFDGKYTKFHPYDRQYNTSMQNEVAASMKVAKGIIEDVSFESELFPKKESGYVSVHITDPQRKKLYKEHPEAIPPEVSNMMIVYDAENEPNVSDWEIVHLSSVPKGAYDDMKPLAVCIGGKQCINELHGSAKSDSFELPDKKIKLREKLTGAVNNQTPDPKDLNKYKVEGKDSDSSKQNPNSPTGESKDAPIANQNNDQFTQLSSDVSELTKIVKSIVDRDQAKEADARMKAIEELIPKNFVGVIYKDETERSEDIKKKAASNYTLAEISELTNTKQLAIQTANAIQNSPELRNSPEFANLPSNTLVGSAQKDDMSEAEKIAKMREIGRLFH